MPLSTTIPVQWRWKSWFFSPPLVICNYFDTNNVIQFTLIVLGWQQMCVGGESKFHIIFSGVHVVKSLFHLTAVIMMFWPLLHPGLERLVSNLHQGLWMWKLSLSRIPTICYRSHLYPSEPKPTDTFQFLFSVFLHLLACIHVLIHFQLTS